MKDVSKALASVSESFIDALNGSSYQTATGKNLIDRYRSITMTSSVTCSLVNSFVKEAKMCTYDSGVNAILESVARTIDQYRYSWMLESACEMIESNTSDYNYLNRNAVCKVRPLLEMNESDVVTYIKAGALRDVMFCESFRRIAKSVFADSPIVESTREFTVTHPISIVEKAGDSVYFTVEGSIYKMNEDGIQEALRSEVSNEFLNIAGLLESRYIEYENETLKYQGPSYTIQISEEGKCKKIDGERVHEMTTDQLRESSALYLSRVSNQAKHRTAAILESLAKICENFNNIAILDSVSVFNTGSDRFVVMDTPNGNTYAKLLSSSHSSPWSLNENMYDVVSFIRKKTNVDLKEYYEEKIEKVISEAESEQAQVLKESIQQDAISLRRKKIEALTEEFKNDPVKLAVLSKVAQDLNAL